MIHDDGKLTLEPAGERERTMCAEDRTVCVLLCIQCQGITWDGEGQVGAGGHPRLARGGGGGAHPSGTASD